ncbi:GMC family oxidoreductase N-terminal domain-containing protein, partial [Streptomyces boluensis]
MGSRTGQEREGGFDYDWVVIGSGFGGSVAALRLAERGYRVCVLEAGRRYPTSELPASTWDLRRYFWMPRLGLRGILRVSAFRDVSIISSSGVGGGSLVYAQTLYRRGETFREHLDMAVGEHVDLDRCYAIAERMLGVVDTPVSSPRDAMARAVADDLRLPPDRFHATRIGVFRGKAGVTVPDPYVDGEGPERTGCTDCGRCMVGCRVGAKNTLDKNYLWLAERRGARIEPDREVTDITPLGAADGSDGYAITARRPGSTVRRGTRVLRARGVVVAAGAVGTARLLATCRHRGSLPALSERLGHDVRTNAESICAITARDPNTDLSKGVAISGSLQATDDMHLEPVGYGGAADSMGLLFVPLSGDGTRLTRPLGLLKEMLRHPVDLLRSANPRGWSRRSMLIGGMWTQDGALGFVARRRLLGRGVRLTT